MALARFEGLGWFLVGVIVAPACYLVNSQGAAEQAKLNATKAAIVTAQKDIRSLETEFNTRANLAQLERWNGDVLALAAPVATQYLPGEAALASLDRVDAQAQPVETAALVVPAAATPPAAPVQAAAAAPSPAPAPAPAVKPAAPVRVAAATPTHAAPAHAAPARVAAMTVSPAQQDGNLRKLMRKADRRAVAMMGDGVLSTSTISDLEKLAKREKLALR